MRTCIYMFFRTTIRDIEIVLYRQGYLFLMLLNYVILLQDYCINTEESIGRFLLTFPPRMMPKSLDYILEN